MLGQAPAFVSTVPLRKSAELRIAPQLLRFLSVIGPAVCRLSGGGFQAAPGLASGLIELAFLLLGELFVGDEFFHRFLLVTLGVEKFGKLRYDVWELNDWRDRNDEDVSRDRHGRHR